MKKFKEYDLVTVEEETSTSGLPDKNGGKEFGFVGPKQPGIYTKQRAPEKGQAVVLFETLGGSEFLVIDREALVPA